MSWLSDFVRGTTGGLGVGETAGGFIGGYFGGPEGALTGSRIGGGVTEFLDMDRGAGQATARDISPNLPQETGMSGQQSVPYLNIPVYPGGQATQAGFGAVAPFVQQSGNILTKIFGTPGGGLAVGAGGATALDYVVDFFTGQPKKLVITRKMQREVKELYHYMNMDINAVSAAYSSYKGIQVTPAQIQKILLKKFRNDGPYVTKAAIRKTRSTVRKLERLEMLKKQITGKPSTTRRRASSTTRITQVK